MHLILTLVNEYLGDIQNASKNKYVDNEITI